MKGHIYYLWCFILVCSLQELRRCSDLYFVLSVLLGKSNSRKKTYVTQIVVACDLNLCLFLLCMPGAALCICLKSTKACNVFLLGKCEYIISYIV